MGKMRHAQNSEAHVQRCLTQLVCGIPLSLLLHTVCYKTRTGTSVARETGQVQDKLKSNICSGKAQGNQSEKQYMEDISPGADSLSFSASSLPALWLTKDDSNDTEVTESFPCTLVGRSALGLAEQHLALASLGHDILDSPQP